MRIQIRKLTASQGNRFQFSLATENTEGAVFVFLDNGVYEFQAYLDTLGPIGEWGRACLTVI